MAVNENKILGPANILRDGTLTISGATGLLLLLLVWVLLSSLTRQIREKNLQLDAISSTCSGACSLQGWIGPSPSSTPTTAT